MIWATENTLEFGGNPDHVTSGLSWGRVRVTIDVPRHTRQNCDTVRVGPSHTRRPTGCIASAAMFSSSIWSRHLANVNKVR